MTLMEQNQLPQAGSISRKEPPAQTNMTFSCISFQEEKSSTLFRKALISSLANQELSIAIKEECFLDKDRL